MSTFSPPFKEYGKDEENIQTHEKLSQETMGEEIIEASAEGGLDANMNKTKYMDNSKKKR